MENFSPVSSFLGGMLIGLSILFLFLFNGRIAGVSGIMSGVIFNNKSDRLWRMVFLLGLVVGPFLYQYFGSQTFIPRENYPLALLILGGIFVGFGTRLGSGCTSGHGICGIARLSMRSIIATLVFMVSGMATVYLIKYVLGITS